MGICSFGNEYTTENDAENLFIQVLYSYNKINDYSKRDFIGLFSNIKSIKQETKEEIIEEKEIYISTDYQKQFVEKLVEEGTVYTAFHRSLLPSFEELFTLYIDNNPEYNIMTFAISYLRDKNKFRIAAETIDSDSKVIHLNALLKFIKHYLDHTLIQTTKRLISKLYEFGNNTVLKGTDYFIDESFKKNADKALAIFENSQYFEYIEANIKQCLKKNKAILNNSEMKNELSSNDHHMNLNIDENDDIILTKKHYELLNTEFPFLFNTLDVRKDAWNLIKNKSF